MDKPQMILHQYNQLNYTAYDCKWIPSSAKFVVLGGLARGTGCIDIFEVTANDVKHVKQIEKSKPVKCGTFGATSLQQRHLATGDFDGRMCIWNLEQPDIPIYHVKGHKEIINAIDGVGGLNIGEGAPEIVTGSRDGMG
ncbi:putative WD repeat-containing protein 92 [Hypsibius exemplaris]|uniref:WD repeat-containing protein 92 n=1 Tax=Hypsibius exemplaris TaxID=2072580 RepID=A0A9X6RLN3_HYPEX|nr:putative WD repeat-containing protein 92 [Hypsibius exemplaris]